MRGEVRGIGRSGKYNRFSAIQISNLDIKIRFSYLDQSIKHTHKKTRQPDQRLGVGVYDMKKLGKRMFTLIKVTSRE